ncbi:MAG: 2-oxoglutarate dehydrogenase E1 component [Phycisphaerae bacterium]
MNDHPFAPNDLSLAYLENLFADYSRDPESVPEDYRDFFARHANGAGSAARLGPVFGGGSIFHARVVSAAGSAAPTLTESSAAALQHRVDQMIRAFRIRGHIVADIDPLDRPRPRPPELETDYYQFSAWELDQPVAPGTIGGRGVENVRGLVERLNQTYCGPIGIEFMHIDDLQVRGWLQERLEGIHHQALSREAQLRILTRLTDAVMFEQFILKKFIGKKSFSLDGAETLIPLLDIAIEKAAEQGLAGVILAMAHRGRLNVLANVMGKSPKQIFREFEDIDPDLHIGRGDVKYHLGYSSDWITQAGKTIHLSLCFNPSHLEFVNPVALGRMRANQDRVGDRKRELGMVILIHGDAALAGEGVVQETLNLSELPAYTTGGTLHVVVNNQVGFTTDPEQGRSSTYCTDVFKMLNVPIFHVNGEDPESVAQVVQLALDFRQRFRRDVVIDMYCFRRLGHNEGDEPMFTQPLMYRTIAQRKSVLQSYRDRLLKLNGVKSDEADRIAELRYQHLEQELTAARTDEARPRGPQLLRRAWLGLSGGLDAETPDTPTGAPRERLAALLDVQTRLPADFHPHPKIAKLLADRREMARGERPLDWGAAEALAFATTAADGTRIRVTGQDCERGTFSHRHAVLHDVEDGRRYMPLAHLASSAHPAVAELHPFLPAHQGTVEIVNSPLSETGVLGFEYGYSLDYPEALVCWEAQFGDFANAAQVIIDQFVVSAEAKWRRLSGVVMLLPDGFEGQGPEHSSARLERFLSLAAEDNIQIVVPSTPAQYFHVLRRQVLRRWRKPLVVMTPKSLLRHPQAVSTLEELEHGTFERVLGDRRFPNAAAARDVRRVLLCCGKLYYELDARRQERGRADVAILRLAQLYPLPGRQLEAALAPFADGTPVVWVQDAPENQGAWQFLRYWLGDRLLNRHPFAGVYRPPSASPATGSFSSHKLEQERLLAEAFDEVPDSNAHGNGATAERAAASGSSGARPEPAVARRVNMRSK